MSFLRLAGPFLSRRPSGLRKTIGLCNSLAHRTTWLRSDLRCVQKAGTYSLCVYDTQLQGIPLSRRIISISDPYYDVFFKISRTFFVKLKKGWPPIKPEVLPPDPTEFLSFTPCKHHCSTRAAQNFEGHHSPVLAPNFQLVFPICLA